MRLRAAAFPFICRYDSTDFATLREIFVGQEYEEALKHVPADCRSIVDLGANAGYSVRLWMERFPDCRVLGAEADSENAAICRANVALAGGMKRCDIQEVCLVGKSRSVYLNRSGGDWAIQVTDVDTGTAAVNGIRVDELLTRCNAPKTIDLLKCDIEGAEAEVFATCSNWIARFRYLIVEIHPPYSYKALLADLERNNAHSQVAYRRDKGMGLELAVLEL